MPPEMMMTYRQLAERWKLSVKTLQRLVRKNQIPATLIGGSTRFALNQIEALERQGLDGVAREAFRDLVRQFGVQVACAKVMEGLTDEQAQARFDEAHAEELSRLTINLGGSQARARACIVADLNRQSGIKLSSAPTKHDIARALRERQSK